MSGAGSHDVSLRRRGRGRAAHGTVDVLTPVERDSTPSIIAARIRDAIIDGSLPPGMQLGESQLATRLDVSRGPVREAMQRLLQEGLLRAERHRGVFVVELGADEVQDVYLARAAVEHTAVRLLTRRQDPAAFAALAKIVEQMRRAARAEDWARVADRDLAFHEQLVAITESKRLIRMFRTLLAETRMCVMAVPPAYWAGNDLPDQHDAIVEAMRGGDELLAIERFDAHVVSAIRDLQLAGPAGARADNGRAGD